MMLATRQKCRRFGSCYGDLPENLLVNSRDAKKLLDNQISCQISVFTVDSPLFASFVGLKNGFAVCSMKIISNQKRESFF
jgi:hypothetical protein